MNPRQRVLVRFRRLLAQQNVERFACQGIQHIFEPRGPLRMALGQFVQQTGGMRNEGSGHRQ